MAAAMAAFIFILKGLIGLFGLVLREGFVMDC